MVGLFDKKYSLIITLLYSMIKQKILLLINFLKVCRDNVNRKHQNNLQFIIIKKN